jgi:hypothetical protein
MVSPPAGAKLGCLIEVDAAAGTALPMTYTAGSSGDSSDSSYDGGTTSLGTPGFLAANGGSNSGTRLWKPTMVEIEHGSPAIAYLGGSRPNGKGNQPAGYGLIRGGYAKQTTYKAGKPITSFTRDGDQLHYWLASLAWRRPKLASFTDIYVDLGFNDIYNRSAEDTGTNPIVLGVKSEYNAFFDLIHAAAPSARIHIVQIGIRTGSTSLNWPPPPDQTPDARYTGAADSARSVVNASRLVGQRGITSLIDLAPDYYQDASNPDVYYSDGVTNKQTTGDGAHFTAFGEARIGAAGSRAPNKSGSLRRFATIRCSATPTTAASSFPRPRDRRRKWKARCSTGSIRSGRASR